MNILQRYVIKCLLTVFILQPFCSLGQIKTYSFNQIDSLQKIEKKTVVVFIHTNWCKFCAAMFSTTFKQEDVIKKMNKDFYFIELDAEEKKTITLNSYHFKNKQTGANTGIHELAEHLATIDKTISYPTLCFLNEKYEIIYQQKDYVNAKYLLAILILLSGGLAQ